MPERLLISGSRGFIGERLVQKAEQQGHEVRRIYHDGGAFNKEEFEDFNPDKIFHLAAYGNHYNQRDVMNMLMSNVVRTHGLLDVTKNIDYEAFVVVGSSSEYGKKEYPMVETDVLEPDTFYAATKAAATMIASAWARQMDKPVVVARPFSVTGVGDDENHLIPKLIRSCMERERMPFVPGPKHDWVDIDDVVRGLDKIAGIAKKYKGEVYNLGSERQYSNQEVLLMVQRLTGRKANIEVVSDMRSYDKDGWVSDISKLRRFYWRPEKSLEQSITEMVAEYARTKS